MASHIFAENLASLSTPGNGSQSDRSAVLVQRMQGLEAQVQELSRPVSSTRSGRGSPEVSSSGGCVDEGTQRDDVVDKEEIVEGSAEEERTTEVSGNPSVAAELAFLRHEMATLRREMEMIRRSEDQLPPYST